MGARLRFEYPGPCNARYGAEQGRAEVRQALCDRFYAHLGRKANEVFVSDGSKCDIGRLQMMFGAQTSVAVQARCSSLLPFATCLAPLHLPSRRSATLLVPAGYTSNVEAYICSHHACLPMHASRQLPGCASHNDACNACRVA